MPLTKKGRKIMKAMKGEYGNKKGEQIFYATKNKGKIKGVEKAAMGRAMFKQTTSKAPGDAQMKVKEPYVGSYIKSELDGNYISNKSYENYYGEFLKGI
jgi:hypothetical protein|tara:strand:+ start:2868 stop:3164 length:297 start_codon:yes stop_codon:yes gene_type:complete